MIAGPGLIYTPTSKGSKDIVPVGDIGWGLIGARFTSKDSADEGSHFDGFGWVLGGGGFSTLEDLASKTPLC